jgi:hypothetical protein
VIFEVFVNVVLLDAKDGLGKARETFGRLERVEVVGCWRGLRNGWLLGLLAVHWLEYTMDRSGSKATLSVR